MKNSCIKLFTLILIIILSSSNCFSKSTNSSSKGYIGTLPDLTRKYTSSEDNEKQPIKGVPSRYFNSENDLKPVPQDDPTFVNIILKPGKPSKYITDLNEFIPMLESIFDIIENNESVQVFNAKVYFFNTNADYFRDEYSGKPESNYVTYKKLMELNSHARSVALLRSEALKYNPYLSYHSEGYVYNPNNIQQQLDYLKSEIQQTILLLRDAK